MCTTFVCQSQHLWCFLQCIRTWSLSWFHHTLIYFLSFHTSQPCLFFFFFLFTAHIFMFLSCFVLPHQLTSVLNTWALFNFFPHSISLLFLPPSSKAAWPPPSYPPSCIHSFHFLLISIPFDVSVACSISFYRSNSSSVWDAAAMHKLSIWRARAAAKWVMENLPIKCGIQFDGTLLTSVRMHKHWLT